jgi:VIT1/CCC1 family predicted Fe2+/Mn2+ transporter
MSMAAGEYVSVSSQSDAEKADLARERAELAAQPKSERDELANIYIARGLDQNLARQVADQLMEKDALGAHARDELGISEVLTASPLQAALTSASTFSAGAIMPLALVAIAPRPFLIPLEIVVSLLCLALLGALGAWTGGAPITRSVLRVAFWGALAMALTASIGRLFGASI